MEALQSLFAPVPDDATFARLVRAVLPIYFEGGGTALAEAVADRMRLRAAPFNRGQFELLPRIDVTGRLGHIQGPVLCLGGADDWVAPPGPGAERLARGIPEAKLRVLERCGHFPFLERPQAFAHAVSAWARADVLGTPETGGD